MSAYCQQEFEQKLTNSVDDVVGTTAALVPLIGSRDSCK
jgi:hypothetical protein